MKQAQMDKNGNPVQSIDYRPAGVILDLKPQIREDVAELAISQQISNFIPTTMGVNASPTLIKRELSTSVGIKPDEILFLGGLDENKTTDETSCASFLPTWLRSTLASQSRTEVLLILQAQRI